MGFVIALTIKVLLLVRVFVLHLCAGFLGVHYTGSDLRDAFLTCWVANNRREGKRNVGINRRG